MDFSGTIVDPGSSSYKVDDKVYGSIEGNIQMKKGEGSLAEYITVSHVPGGYTCTRPVPANVSMRDVSGLVLTSQTAWQAMVKVLHLKHGQSIFINGGSGGVGIFAVQIARAIVGKEGKVYSSCSDKNRDLVLSLGADEVGYFAARDRCTAYAH